MSFAHEVKSEVLESSIVNECCMLSFLSSIIHSCGEIRKSKEGIDITLKTDISSLFDRVNECLMHLYGEKADMKVVNDTKLNRKVRYDIYIPKSLSKRLLFDCDLGHIDDRGEFTLGLGIDSHILENECCEKTYVKGVFATSSTSNIVLGGNKNNRKFCGYHWEFVFTDEAFANDFSSLLFSLGISNKKSIRKKQFVLYIKEAEKISDLLALVGAFKGLLRLQNEMTFRQVRNDINRQNNCLNANITKTVRASVEQIHAIKIIKKAGKFSSLSSNLKELCTIRLKNPDASLEKLTKLMSIHITKSGINHQFHRLIDIAKNIEKN